MKSNGFILLDFLFTRRSGFAFSPLLEHYREIRCPSAGAKFNMKHSLKPWTSSALGRARRSSRHAEDHTGSLHQHHPLQRFSSIQELSPCSATRFPQRQLHTRNRGGSVKHGSLHNFSNLHQICHHAHFISNNDVIPIFLMKIISGMV